MSKKRRTKKQKLKAKQVMPQARVKVETSLDEVQLFRYDKRLIYKDLLRSFLITGLILTLLLGVYFWLK